MTREEAIVVLKAFMENPLFSDVHKQAFNIAIHDIKQRHDWDINKLMLVPKAKWEQESKTGHWIYIGQSYLGSLKICECSNCKKRTYGSHDYCPNCGAKMREVVEE